MSLPHDWILSIQSLTEISSATIDEVSSLDQAVLDYPWSREQWQALKHDYIVLLAIGPDDAVRGFCLFQFTKADDFIHLLKIGVANQYRRQGLADSMLAYMAQWAMKIGAKRIGLEVEAQNISAKALYLKHGAKIVHQVKSYYRDGKAADRMLIDLGPMTS